MIAVGAGMLALGAGGAGVAMATGSGDGEGRAQRPAGRSGHGRSAEDHRGAAAPTRVERDSENGATWEVEVTKPDGNTVDVRLDEGYGIVVVEGDSEAGPGE